MLIFVVSYTIQFKLNFVASNLPKMLIFGKFDLFGVEAFYLKKRNGRIVAECCSVLQCVAVCCSVLQCVAECCSVLQCVAVCCSVLQCVAVCCSVLQCVAVCPFDALSCRLFSTKEPLIIGLFGGQWRVKIRHPMGLRHPVEFNWSINWSICMMFLFGLLSFRWSIVLNQKS